jgi:hypothetical protein
MYASNLNGEMPLYKWGINEPYISKLLERFLPLLHTVRGLFSNGEDRKFLHPLPKKGQGLCVF